MDELIDNYKKGDYDKCIAICEELLRENQLDSSILEYYGSCLLKRKMFIPAIDIFSRLLQEEEKFYLYTFRGDCNYGIENYEKAVDDYIKSIELDPSNGATYDNAARAYYRMGKKDEAYKYIDKAIEISGGEYDPLTLKAIFLRLDNRTAESFKLLSQIRIKFPDKEFLREEQFRIIEEALSPKK